MNVAAQVTLSAPNVLPGNDGRTPAAGRQEEPQVSKGSDSYLAVWTDARTALADNGTTGLNTGLDNTGLGTMLDIYAARVNLDKLAGAAGLTVTLSGDATATAQTDAQGRYSFAGLPVGGAYTVMLTTPGWAALPYSRTYIDCRSDKAADFEATPESAELPPSEPVIGYVELPAEPCAPGGCDPIPSPGAADNLIDKSTYFVAYHYLDFLGRGPDTSGLKFWKSEMDACGADAVCREVKRINVSAAFFLSIEFQETGYLVYRMGLASYGEAPRYRRLMSDSRSIATGVQVGQGEWSKPSSTPSNTGGGSRRAEAVLEAPSGAAENSPALQRRVRRG